MNLTECDVDTKNNSVTIECDEDTLTLHSKDNPFSLSLRISSFGDEKEFDSFIRNVERLIRSSNEYRVWVRYITETLGHNECSLTKELLSECKVVIHHHPINLYTICKAVIVSLLSNKTPFCSFDIATKVIELHFKNKIGYMPLLSDIHDKFHQGFQDLPIEFVYGDYKYILKNYVLDENDTEKIYSLCNVHLKDVKKTWSRDNYPGLDEFDNLKLAVGQ